MGIGLESVAYYVPTHVRTNDYWREYHPELVASASEGNLAKLWKPREATAPNIFDRILAPYVEDPFRGAVERRIRGEHESALDMEAAAARAALAAARWTASEVDVVLVSSFLPDRYGPGNAAWLVRELGMRCPGINLESACSSSLVALNTGVALVQSGQYRNALVVASCSYSRLAAADDSMSWFLGDGAGAMLIGAVPDDRGWVAQHTVNTASTCDTFRLDMEVDPVHGVVPRMRISKDSAQIINESGESAMRAACSGALARAGIGIDDVACAVVNTPTAWYADFASELLGIDRAKILSTYTSYANMGPALIPVNLHASAEAGMLRDGDWVLLYAVGSVSTAVATVMRWHDGVGLGASA
jgi:3-oxoacyl-[acyl-carrier-protein] synthase-3